MSFGHKNNHKRVWSLISSADRRGRVHALVGLHPRIRLASLWIA
jgi:hypothetical protein